jgi:hypothetical protein
MRAAIGSAPKLEPAGSPLSDRLLLGQWCVRLWGGAYPARKEAQLAAGVISDYALFGAIAQMRYTEAVSTMDADILVTIAAKSSIDILRPIYEYCASRGCQSGVIALSTGRPKDYARLLALLASGSVSRDDLRQLAERHGLSGTWQRFQARFLDQ